MGVHMLGPTHSLTCVAHRMARDRRRAAIQRYLAKRNRRRWGRRAVYECRKELAQARPRVQGRFVASTTVWKSVTELQ